MNFFAIPDHITNETHYINLNLVKRISYIDKNPTSKLISISVHYIDNSIEFYDINQIYFNDLTYKLN